MEIHGLATGPVSPLVAMIFAMLGSLLGVLLVTLARRRTGLRRVRLVVYAAVAVAVPAIWLPAIIAVLALRVEGSVLRLSLEPLGISLGVAAGATLLALLPVCFGRPGPVRQAIAGLFLAGAIGGTGMFVGEALVTGEPIGANQTSIGVAIAIASVTGFGLAGALAATRNLRRAVATSAVLGLALAGVYHVASAALRIQPAPGGPIQADDVAGLVPARIGLPVVIGVAVILALLWYFTLGSATVRDLRLIFNPNSDAEQIEPWMIEQVRTRVALSSTAYAPVPGLPEIWARNEPTVAVHAVPIGRGLADAFSRPRPARAHRDWAADDNIETNVNLNEVTAIDVIASPIVDDDQSDPGDDRDLAEVAAPAGSRATADWPAATTGTAWQTVPSWGLPTSPWSQAEFDQALGLAGDDAGDYSLPGDYDLRGEYGRAHDGPAYDGLAADGGPAGYDAGPAGYDDGPEADWPPLGRNEPGVAHRGGTSPRNSRFGPLPGPAPERPGNTTDDAFDWSERIRAAASRAAAAQGARPGHDTGIVIVHEPSADPLPRRNARPISRP